MTEEKRRALEDLNDAREAVERLSGILRRARDSGYADVQACAELAIERADDVLAWTKILAEDYLDEGKERKE